MKTFEHCEEHCVFQEHVVIESNKYGRDGWELAAVVPVDKSDRRKVDGRACFDLYFKREVMPKPTVFDCRDQNGNYDDGSVEARRALH